MAARATLQYLRDPFHRGVMESFSTLARAIPTGVFDNRAIDEFLARLFAAPGRTNDFRKLKRKLFLVATNLDTGASGHVRSAPARARADLARDRGVERAARACSRRSRSTARTTSTVRSTRRCMRRWRSTRALQLLLCVNPLVPFDASRATRGDHLSVDKLHRGGLPLVLGQTFRAIIHSRMKVGMEKYRSQYPDADVLLFEPDREDADMFFANIFSYRQRKRLCAIGVREDAAEHRWRARACSRRYCASTASRSGTTGSPKPTATSGWR